MVSCRTWRVVSIEIGVHNLERDWSVSGVEAFGRSQNPFIGGLVGEFDRQTIFVVGGGFLLIWFYEISCAGGVDIEALWLLCLVTQADASRERISEEGLGVHIHYLILQATLNDP